MGPAGLPGLPGQRGLPSRRGPPGRRGPAAGRPVGASFAGRARRSGRTRRALFPFFAFRPSFAFFAVFPFFAFFHEDRRHFGRRGQFDFAGGETLGSAADPARELVAARRRLGEFRRTRFEFERFHEASRPAVDAGRSRHDRAFAVFHHGERHRRHFFAHGRDRHGFAGHREFAGRRCAAAALFARPFHERRFRRGRRRQRHFAAFGEFGRAARAAVDPRRRGGDDAVAAAASLLDRDRELGQFGELGRDRAVFGDRKRAVSRTGARRRRAFASAPAFEFRAGLRAAPEGQFGFVGVFCLAGREAAATVDLAFDFPGAGADFRDRQFVLRHDQIEFRGDGAVFGDRERAG